MSLDKQRKISDFPQGGIINSQDGLNLGYACIHNNGIMLNTQFGRLNHVVNNINSSNINMSDLNNIRIDFNAKPDVEKIVEGIITQLKKVK